MAKMGKQMGYADKRNIPFVILAGDKEIENQSYTLKNHSYRTSRKTKTISSTAKRSKIRSADSRVYERL